MNPRRAFLLPLLLLGCESATAPAPSLLPVLSVDDALYINGGDDAPPDFVLGDRVGAVEERIHCSDVMADGEPGGCPDPRPGTRIWSNTLPVGTPVYAVRGFGADRVLVVFQETLRVAWTAAREPVGPALSLGIGDGATIEDLSIRFIEVTEDSRCPTSVACFWEGNARVVLEVRYDGVTSVIRLDSARGSRSAGIGPYTLDMLRLDPYPEHPDVAIPPDTYRLSLQVSRSATG